ncbi:MAG: phosphatidylethanolamine N-methyltransferase [Gallionellaceae bacterium]|nr:MAG: phosphatidylethanolamine N-methyltransferase [Gallionellaceae bacterium]
MPLKTSYRFIAPFYDAFIESGIAADIRRRSLAKLPQQDAAQVLIGGAGTGLDFPFLPPCHEYTALDLTAAMLARSKPRMRGLQMRWVRGDSMVLPFAAHSFDYVVLHLILAVVPQPQKCLAEAMRVLKPGGRILLFDKFLRRGQRAWLRRSLSPLAGRLATRLDVVFEDVLDAVPELRVLSDQPALARGWFRLIELQKEKT